MAGKETGGPAFPVRQMVQDKGMTLRDYFAGQSPYTTKDAKDVISIMNSEQMETTSLRNMSSVLAEMNYSYADAMIKEKNK